MNNRETRSNRKVVVIGDGSTAKEELLKHYIGDDEKAIGSINQAVVKCEQKNSILNLWNIPEQISFAATQAYAKRATDIVLIVSVEEKSSNLEMKDSAALDHSVEHNSNPEMKSGPISKSQITALERVACCATLAEPDAVVWIMVRYPKERYNPAGLPVEFLNKCYENSLKEAIARSITLVQETRISTFTEGDDVQAAKAVFRKIDDRVAWKAHLMSKVPAAVNPNTKPGFFTNFTTNHPYLWGMLKWLTLGAIAATVLYFTGGLAAIPFLAPVLAKLGTAAIGPLSWVAGAALAAVWYGSKLLVNNVVKPFCRCIIKLCCCCFSSENAPDNVSPQSEVALSSSHAHTGQILRGQQSSQQISNGQNSVPSSDNQDASSGIAVEFGAQNGPTSFLGKFGNAGKGYVQIKSSENNEASTFRNEG